MGKAVSTVTGWLFLSDPRFSHQGSFLLFWATRSSPQLGSSCLCTEPPACAGGAGLRVSRRGSGRDLGRSPCCLGSARGRCRWTEGGVLGDPGSPQAWPRCECPGRKVSQAPQGCGAGRTSPPGRGPYHLRLRLAIRLGEDDAAGETPRREPDVQGQAVAPPLGHGRARGGQGRHAAPPLRPAAPRPRLPRAWAQSPHGGASGTGASRPLGLAPMLALPAWPGPPGPAPECPLRAARLRPRPRESRE